MMGSSRKHSQSVVKARWLSQPPPPAHGHAHHLRCRRRATARSPHGRAAARPECYHTRCHAITACDSVDPKPHVVAPWLRAPALARSRAPSRHGRMCPCITGSRGRTHQAPRLAAPSAARLHRAPLALVATRVTCHASVAPSTACPHLAPLALRPPGV